MNPRNLLSQGVRARGFFGLITTADSKEMGKSEDCPGEWGRREQPTVHRLLGSPPVGKLK